MDCWSAIYSEPRSCNVPRGHFRLSQELRKEMHDGLMHIFDNTVVFGSNVNCHISE